MKRELTVPTVALPTRAAQYVRMSTDNQRYSIDNQIRFLAAYAASKHLTIVETYSDEGLGASSVEKYAGTSGRQLVFRCYRSLIE